MRTINISAGCLDTGETDADKWAQLHEQCGETDADKWAQLHEQCGGTDEPIRAALGYLSLWNWSTYPVVDIVLMGRKGSMELCAYYRSEPGGKAGYVIGAVWHGDHFGFHS